MTTPNAPTKYMIAAGHLRGLNTAPRPTVRYNDCEVIDVDDDCDAPQDPAPDHVVIPMAPSPDDDCDIDQQANRWPIPYRITPEALGVSDRARVVIRHPARLAADQVVPMRMPRINKTATR